VIQRTTTRGGVAGIDYAGARLRYPCFRLYRMPLIVCLSVPDRLLQQFAVLHWRASIQARLVRAGKFGEFVRRAFSAAEGERRNV